MEESNAANKMEAVQTQARQERELTGAAGCGLACPATPWPLMVVRHHHGIQPPVHLQCRGRVRAHEDWPYKCLARAVGSPVETGAQLSAC